MRFTRLYRLFLILLSPLLILNCGQLLDIMNELDKQEATAPNTNLGEPGKWTTLVYLDADNNLEGAGVADVQEMISRAPQYSGNKVYVLMDRIGGYSSASMPDGFGNFTGARLFEVTSTGTLTPVSPGVFLSLGSNDGTTEINMGDKDTLENFIKWGLAQADADGSKYVFLDIWDHGAGWGGNAYGGNAVAWDDTNSHDALSITEIRTAITNAHAAGTSNGKRVTILGFDACYMGTAENAFAFKDLVSIMVGSEETEPGNGWDYSKWLPSGDTSPADLGSQLVTSYGSYYNGSGNNITLSAYNLSQIPALEASINKFVDSLVG
ncbi:MAG TPA: clostripain-related cysteine peptidase, partial [Turneriella sp.]|nr:clostripain-related cysteine peptidase [Turneriella sp.]